MTRTAILDAATAAGVHVIDLAYIAPGVGRLTVTPGQARTARNAMIMAGFDASTRDDATVTVVANAD